MPGTITSRAGNDATAAYPELARLVADAEDALVDGEIVGFVGSGPARDKDAPALRELSVTAVSRLIRDPYAIYAARVLRLRALDPLRPLPDAAERGNVLHDIVRRFLTPPPGPADPPEALRVRLLGAADEVLALAAQR